MNNFAVCRSMDWRLLTCIVCFYGFLKDFRPSDAYLTRFLLERKNVTIEQIDNEIYPWYSYFYLVWLVPVLLLTDLCRYKPMIILDSLARFGTWAIFLWAHGETSLKVSQIVFALSSAATISYYSYIYANVSVEHFQKVSGFIHGAALIGKFSGFLLGQLLVSFSTLDLYSLNVITFVDMCFGCVLSLLLPTVDVSGEGNLQYRAINNIDPNDQPLESINEQQVTKCEKLKYCFGYIKRKLKEMYSSRSVILWSLWWALASCGYYQVSTYIQNMWAIIAPHRENRKLYNGAVEAAGTLLASFSVLVVGFLPWDWSARGRGEALMAAVFAVNSVCMILIATTKNIWLAYALYDVFRATYHGVLTMAAAQISKSLPRYRYGFVFGCNTFVTLVIETVLTVVVVDRAGFSVNVRTQFLVYGGYFGVLAVLFLVVVLLSVFRDGCCCHGNNDLEVDTLDNIDRHEET